MVIAIVLFLLSVIAIWLGLVYAKYRIAQVPDKKNLQAAVDIEVNKALRGRLLPGLVVGVYKNGRVVIKGYGSVTKETDAEPLASTVFQIGSLSKVFTATLVQVLCDEGVIAMDATLGELIGRSVPLSPAVQSVTLRQLVTHTSGLASIPKSLGEKLIGLVGKENLLVNPYSHLEPELVFDYLATAQDKRPPGRFEYSNLGMGLVGHVLEMVTGKRYETLVVEKVLEPLGMKATAISATAEMNAHLAQGYTAKGVATGVWTFASLAAAGAFYSTAENMMRFIQANLEGETAISSPLQKMREPQAGGRTGIGWLQPGFLDRFFGNSTLVWHNGMVGGYASYLSVDAANRTGVVILANQATSVDMLGMMLNRQLRTQSWSDAI